MISNNNHNNNNNNFILQQQQQQQQHEQQMMKYSAQQLYEEQQYKVYRINDNLSFTLPICYEPMYYPAPNNDKVKRIGEGAYGCVIGGYDLRRNRCTVAIKKVASLFTQEPPYLKRVAREIKILKLLRGHANIVELQELFIIANDLYIVMNMMNTDLKLDLEFGCKNGRNGRYHPEKTKIILYGILKGLQVIHSNQLIHRDLKPGNILLGMSETMGVKVQICDFGMSSTQHKTNGGSNSITPMDSRYVVTRMYRPPEIILESPNQTCAIDMFSVGCIFAEMLFAEQDPPQSRRLFGADSSCSRREHGGELRHLYLIASICGTPDWNDIDGSDSAKQVLRHQHWFQNKLPPKDMRSELFPASSEQAVQLLKSMLHFNPSQRCTVDQALNSSYFHGFKDPFGTNNTHTTTSDDNDDSDQEMDDDEYDDLQPQQQHHHHQQQQQMQEQEEQMGTDYVIRKLEFPNNIDKFSLQQVRQWFRKEVESLNH